MDIKTGAMVAGTLGMLGIALGVAAQSIWGIVAIILGSVGVALAAKTLSDMKKMERENGK